MQLSDTGQANISRTDVFTDHSLMFMASQAYDPLSSYIHPHDQQIAAKMTNIINLFPLFNLKLRVSILLYY